MLKKIKDLEIMQGMVVLTKRKWLLLKSHPLLGKEIINLQSKQKQPHWTNKWELLGKEVKIGIVSSGYSEFYQKTLSPEIYPEPLMKSYI